MSVVTSFLLASERTIILALALSVATAVTLPSRAADVFWNNPAGGDWNVATNLLVTGASSFNGGLLNPAGGTLRLYSQGGSFTTSLLVASGFTNAGTLELTSSNNPAATALNMVSGVLVNSGTLAVLAGAGGTRTVGAPVENRGVAQIQTDLNYSRNWTNQGTLNISAGQTFRVSGTTFNNAPIGIITGNGTFDVVSAVSFGNGGTFAPGAPIGSLNVTGNIHRLRQVRSTFRLAGSLQGALIRSISAAQPLWQVL